MPESRVTNCLSQLGHLKLPGPSVNDDDLLQLESDGLQKLKEVLDEILPKVQSFTSKQSHMG